MLRMTFHERSRAKSRAVKGVGALIPFLRGATPTWLPIVPARKGIELAASTFWDGADGRCVIERGRELDGGHLRRRRQMAVREAARKVGLLRGC